MPTVDARLAQAKVEDLILNMLRDGGCPCRFPRFRATVERDTETLGAQLMTHEQYLLMTMFDRKVRLANKRSVVKRGQGVGHEGECAFCGAFIRRTSVEQVRDQFIDYMTVRPHEGIEDLGAAVERVLPHCWKFYGVVDPAIERARREAELTYPQISFERWLAWMEERRTPETRAI
jgi:hypothetical protein